VIEYNQFLVPLNAMVGAQKKIAVSCNTNRTVFTETDFYYSLVILALLTWLLLLQVATYLRQQTVMRFFFPARIYEDGRQTLKNCSSI
jgi:Trk-type K+ transport system membrane component